MIIDIKFKDFFASSLGKHKLCHDKTCLRGFRPGPTQTGLYNHRRRLEAKEVEELYYLCKENKGAYQLHGYRAADLCLLCLRKCKKQVFS